MPQDNETQDRKKQIDPDAFEREVTTDLDEETPDKPKGLALHTRILIGLAVGVIAFLLAGHLSNPAYVFPAVALGLLFAGAAALAGALFLIGVLFTENSRDRWGGWLVVGLPSLVGSIAGALYAVASAHANNGLFDAAHIAAQTIPFGGIFLSVEILRTPFRRRTLRSIGLAVVRLAIVWLLIWLFLKQK